MKKIKHLGILLSAFLLAGCPSLDINENRPTNVQYLDNNDPNWQQHLQKLKQIHAYSAQGQLGYISAKERFSSRFDWQYQHAKSYRLTLSSTISSSTLTFHMHEKGLTISDHKGNQRSAADAQMLLREIVGMEMPLDKLSTWLKGQPDENADYRIGINHLLANFSYPVDGNLWTADYLNYHQNQSIALPRDILLKNHQQTLKVRVDHWAY